jgi:hypothetical protein
MRVAISSVTFDLDGHVALDALDSSDVDSMERRVNRVKTLDGGVAVSDGGFAHGDRTLTVLWRVQSAAQFAAVQYLVETYAQLHVSLRSGCYLCAVRRLARSADEGRLEIMILGKVS